MLQVKQQLLSHLSILDELFVLFRYSYLNTLVRLRYHYLIISFRILLCLLYATASVQKVLQC